MSRLKTVAAGSANGPLGPNDCAEIQFSVHSPPWMTDLAVTLRGSLRRSRSLRTHSRRHEQW